MDSSGQIQYNNSGAFGGLTNTQLTADINAFSSSLSGAVPASGGGTTNFLRADGTFATPPGSGGLTVGTTTITSGTNGDIEFNNAGVLGEKAVTGTGSVVLAASPALTTPAIASIVNTGTLTLPTSTDTLVGRATTDTMTNKTLTSPTVNGGTMGAATPWTITPGTPTVYVGLDGSSHMVTGTPAGGGNVSTSGSISTGALGIWASGTGLAGTVVPGTGVTTALAVNVGSAGSILVNGGALGTPASGTLTNATGLPAASVVAGALANGMTATTQTGGDNTTKVATDAFVLANGGSTTVTLGVGLGNSNSTYNPGTQTVTNGSNLYLQSFYKGEASSCTVNSTCSSGTNDAGYVLTATAASVTFTLPNPGAVGSAPFTFGYDGTHSYALTTSGGTATFYGSCGGGATTYSSIANSVTVLSDGTNYQCFPNGGSGGGGSVSVTAATPSVVITPSPGTGTFTVGTTAAASANSGNASTYTYQSSDIGTTVKRGYTGGAMADTLPNVSAPGFGAGASFSVCNISASQNDVITPNSPSTIGGASSVTLGPNTCMAIADTDGTNFTVPSPPLSISGLTNGQLAIASGTTSIGSSVAYSNSGASNAVVQANGAVIANSLLNFSQEKSAGWPAGVNPNNIVVFTAAQAETVTAIVGRNEVTVGATATLTVNKAPSGTPCASGTAISSSFNANASATTNQNIISGTPTLAAGDSVCFQTTGGSNWGSGTGIGTITISVKPS